MNERYITLNCNSEDDATTVVRNQGTTGRWTISRDKLSSVVGSTVLLHSGNGQTARRGGTVVELVPVETNTNSLGRVSTKYNIIFDENPSLVGDSRTTNFKPEQSAIRFHSWE
jgi:hypothetical protein